MMLLNMGESGHAPTSIASARRHILGRNYAIRCAVLLRPALFSRHTKYNRSPDRIDDINCDWVVNLIDIQMSTYVSADARYVPFMYLYVLSRKQGQGVVRDANDV
jgi:hypothetical protein